MTTRRDILRLLAVLPVVGAFSRWPRQECVEVVEVHLEDTYSLLAIFTDFVEQTTPEFEGLFSELTPQTNLYEKLLRT